MFPIRGSNVDLYTSTFVYDSANTESKQYVFSLLIDVYSQGNSESMTWTYDR